MGSGLPQTGVELVAQNLSGFLGDLAKGNAAVAGFGHGMETAGAQTKSASQFMAGALQQVGILAVNALQKAGQAIIGFGQDSLKLAGDFAQGMQQFQVAAGKDLDTQGLEQFHDLFLQLGKDLPVSTSDVQEAAIEMVKGGIDPAILAAGALKQNIQFAAAAMGGDLVGAAEISAKVVAGWAAVGSSASEKAALLTHATDLLTKAANASSVDVHELSLGLFNVQSTAKNAGIGLDDVTTVLAELSGDFASSSEAGNSMASFITRLHPTTKAAISAMESLGLVTKDGGNAFYDAKGNFVGFQKASELLKQSLVGLTNEQRQQILQTIFQKDAMGVASGLAFRGADGYQAMADSLENAMGVAEAGSTVQAGYNTAVDNAMGGLEALKITLGEHLLPIMTSFYNFMNDQVFSTLMNVAQAVFGSQDAFDKLSPSMQGLVTTIDLVVADFQKVVGAFQDAGAGTAEFAQRMDDLGVDLGVPAGVIGTITTGVQTLYTYMVDLIDYLGQNTIVIEAVVGALAGFEVITTVVTGIETLIGTVTALGAVFTTAGGGIGGVVALLGGPVTVAVAAVAGAIALLYIAWENDWGGIQEKVASAWAAIQPPLGQLEDWLATNIPVAIQTLANFWTTTLQPALATVGGYIQTYVVPVLKALVEGGLALVFAEVKILADAWQTILWPALKVVWGFIKDDLGPVIMALVNINIAVLQKAAEALAGLWEKVLWPALKKVADYISTNLGPALKSMGDWLNTTFGPALKSINDWLAKVTGGFEGVGGAVNGVVSKLNSFAESVRNVKLPPWLTPGSPTPWEIALLGIGTAINDHVVPGIQTFGQSLTAMASGASGAAQSLTEGLVSSLKGMNVVATATDLGKKAIEGLAQGMVKNMSLITKATDKVADKVETSFGKSFDAASPAGITIPSGENLTLGVIQGMSQQLPALYGLIEGMGSQLMTRIGKVSVDVGSQISDMVVALIDKYNDAKKALGDLQIAGYSSTADIARQKMSNLTATGELSGGIKTNTMSQLAQAEKEAGQLTDAKQSADYFATRSKQIIEIAQLQQQLNVSGADSQQAQDQKTYDAAKWQVDRLTANRQEAIQQLAAAQQAHDTKRTAALQGASDELTGELGHWLLQMNTAQAQLIEDQGSSQKRLTSEQRQDLLQRLALAQQAQDAERQVFAAKLGQGSDTADVVQQLRELMDAKITAKGKTQELPGLFDDDNIRAMYNLFDKIGNQVLPNWLTQPPMSPAQYQVSGSSNSSNTVNNTYNASIYTGQTPAVAQQSFAMMQAMNP